MPSLAAMQLKDSEAEALLAQRDRLLEILVCIAGTTNEGHIAYIAFEAIREVRQDARNRRERANMVDETERVLRNVTEAANRMRVQLDQAIFQRESVEAALRLKDSEAEALLAQRDRLLAVCERALDQQPRCLRDQVGASKRPDCRCVRCDLASAIQKVHDSQIELRILAHLSQDPGLIEAFRQDEDIHAATASSVFGVDLDKVTSEQRRRAKAVNFGVLYGAYSSERVAKKRAADDAKAKAYRADFDRQYNEEREEEHKADAYDGLVAQNARLLEALEAAATSLSNAGAHNPAAKARAAIREGESEEG